MIYLVKVQFCFGLFRTFLRRALLVLKIVLFDASKDKRAERNYHTEKYAYMYCLIKTNNANQNLSFDWRCFYLIYSQLQ